MMKPQRRTPTVYYARFKRPWIFGLVFIVVGLLIVVLASWSVKVECVPVAEGRIDCNIRKTLFGLFEQTEVIPGITGAVLQENRDSDGDTTYRVALVTADGHRPVTQSFEGNRARQVAMLEAITRYIEADSGVRFSYSLPVWWPVYLVFLFPLAGVLVIRYSGGELFIDKEANQVRLVRNKFWGHSEFQCAISKVRGFGIQASSGGRQSTYNVVMKLADGGEVPLFNLSSSGYEAKRRLAQELDAFCHQPISDDAPRSSLPPAAEARICTVCSRPCAEDERVQDPQGRYYHRTCYGLPL